MTSDRYGPKMMDGLRAFQEVAAQRHDDSHPAGYWFADAILVRQGYSEKVAASIIDRLARADFIEWGVSARTGWLTDRGNDAVSGRPVRPIGSYWPWSDRIDDAIARVSIG